MLILSEILAALLHAAGCLWAFLLYVIPIVVLAVLIDLTVLIVKDTIRRFKK